MKNYLKGQVAQIKVSNVCPLTDLSPIDGCNGRKNICFIRKAHFDIVEYVDQFSRFEIYITLSKSVYDKDNLRIKWSHQLFPCINYLP
jgi:hypothetical protein